MVAEKLPHSEATAQRVTHGLVFTAFTSDYDLGHLTMPHNRAYAERHGYGFDCRIRAPYDWNAPGQRHPSWDKVAILLELLDELLDSNSSAAAAAAASHILWIDADAVAVCQDVSLEDLWRDLPSSCELLLGEDVGPACLINAGVFSVHVSEWSRQLWREVWSCSGAVRFHTKLYWEQSVLHKVLAERGEGLERVRPFHSYMGGPRGMKIFPHVCVLPRHAFNTNKGQFCAAAAAASASSFSAAAFSSASSSSSSQQGQGGEVSTILEDTTHRCDFIFHAAGHPTIIIHQGNTWRPTKQQAIRAMLVQHGLLPPAPGEVLDGRINARGPRAPPRKCRPTPLPQRIACRYPGRIAN